MSIQSQRAAVLLLAGVVAAATAGRASGELYVNEIYFDPPKSGGDLISEYIEIRGTPNMSLDNHYLVLVEDEDNYKHTGSTGQIDFIVDLNGRSLSPTGFLTLRQKNNPYTNVPAGPFNLVNTGTGPGWGTGPADNNIGVSSISGDPGKIENSGFTAMIINKGAGPAPTLNMPLDGLVDNDNDPTTPHDGLDYPTGQPGWTILDSVGIYSDPLSIPDKPGEPVFGRTYAPINFGPDVDGTEVSYVDDDGNEHTITFHPNLSPGQTYVGLGYETEFIGRWGNSTGSTAADWHVSNLTDDSHSGFVNAADGFRQSGAYHDNPVGANDFVQTNQYVPYGANLTNTMGSANYPLNLAQLPWDYNHDGVVDAADYTIWKDTYGSTTDFRADGNNGKVVEDDDFAWWMARFNYTVGGPGAGGLEYGGVPEPSTWVLGMIAVVGAAAIKAGRRSV